MQTLSRGFVRGDSLDRMTKEFAQRMGVSESRAATLIHTESAHMAAEAAEQVYRETGVQSYRFEAALDSRPARCAALWISASFRLRSTKPASIIRRCIRAAGVPPFR